MTIPQTTVTMIIILMASGTGMPLLLFIYMRRRFCTGARPFWLGAVSMLIFSFFLESVLKALFLSTPTGRSLASGAVSYALYNGLMAGFFEESARFLVFRTVMKKDKDNDYRSMMFGIGYGSVEMVMVLTLNMLIALTYASIINSGGEASLLDGLTGDALTEMKSQIDSIKNTGASVYLCTLLERFAALSMQVSFSVMVWFAAGNRSRRCLYPSALLLHAAADFAAGLFHASSPDSAPVTVIICVIATAVALIARQIWKDNHDEGQDLRIAKERRQTYYGLGR